ELRLLAELGGAQVLRPEGLRLQGIRGPRAEAAALEAGRVTDVAHQLGDELIVHRHVVIDVTRLQRNVLAIHVTGSAGSGRVEAANADRRVLFIRGVPRPTGE